MKSTAFSTIVLKESMPKIHKVIDYMQQNTQGAKLRIAKIEDDRDDILFFVLATNVMEGDEGALARRFLNAIEKSGHKSTLPINSFKEYPEIQTPEQFNAKVDRYRDRLTKINLYRRNCA